MNRNRRIRNTVSSIWMTIAAIFMILLPLAILLGLIVKSIPVVQQKEIGQLLFSSEWQPAQGKFGFLSFIVSSIIVSLLGLIIMFPLGLLPAIYLTQFANKRLYQTMRSVIDILAGIPSVIHGLWGLLIIVPLISTYIGPFLGRNTAGYTILAGGIVLAVSVIPFVLNMLLEVFRTIPVELKETSLSLGATHWETIRKVVLRKGLPGIIGAYALGLSKAFGETIAVLMVSGNIPQIPHSLFDSGYPLPALIANNYGEMLSIPVYDSALMFAALLLFIVVLVFNSLSRWLIYKTDIA
jgi:phosphate transport system permease protein